MLPLRFRVTRYDHGAAVGLGSVQHETPRLMVLCVNFMTTIDASHFAKIFSRSGGKFGKLRVAARQGLYM
jgi:hypothetical protein